MKVTKQGVRDLNSPGASNPSKVRTCIHSWGLRKFLYIGYDSYRGDYPVFGRQCKYCPEYLEENR